MRRVDAVVVGAGAMGSAAAWWLARAGREVVLLERFEQGHSRGSSHGATRSFRLAYPDRRYVEMARRALPLWRQLEAETGIVLLETTGGVDHGDPAGVDAVAAALAAGGAPGERLSAAEAEARWPGMRFEHDVLFQPDAGRCLADRTVRVLQDAVAALGGEVRFSEPALEIEPAGAAEDQAVRVRTAADTYHAPVCVVAAGAWIARLLPEVPLPPLTVTQEQVFHFPPRDPGAEWPSFIHHRDPYLYGLASPGEGVKVAEHHAGAVVDPDRRDFATDPSGAQRVARYVEEWFPGLVRQAASSTTCLYTSTPDHDFHVRRHGPVVAVSACSGHGFKFTPLIGQTAATLAAG